MGYKKRTIAKLFPPERCDHIIDTKLFASRFQAFTVALRRAQSNRKQSVGVEIDIFPFGKFIAPVHPNMVVLDALNLCTCIEEARIREGQVFQKYLGGIPENDRARPGELFIKIVGILNQPEVREALAEATDCLMNDARIFYKSFKNIERYPLFQSVLKIRQDFHRKRLASLND